MAERTGGCWIVHYSDWSGAWVFDSEIDALRAAVENHADVKWVKWGEHLRGS